MFPTANKQAQPVCVCDLWEGGRISAAWPLFSFLSGAGDLPKCYSELEAPHGKDPDLFQGVYARRL